MRTIGRKADARLRIEDWARRSYCEGFLDERFFICLCKIEKRAKRVALTEMECHEDSLRNQREGNSHHLTEATPRQS